MINSLKQLVIETKINVGKVIAIGFDTEEINYYFQTEGNDKLSPEDFLQQAEIDFESGGQAALLNSITNAKRAIQCQIDQWIINLGLSELQNKKVKKIELLNQLGIAPRILRRVSNARNFLEHEYKAPTIQEVEEALDLAGLFVGISTRAILPVQVALGNIDELYNDLLAFKNGVDFLFDYEQKKFTATAYMNNSIPEKSYGKFHENDIIGKVVINNTETLYMPITRLFLAAGTGIEYKVEKAIRSLWNSLDIK